MVPLAAIVVPAVIDTACVFIGRVVVGFWMISLASGGYKMAKEGGQRIWAKKEAAKAAGQPKA